MSQATRRMLARRLTAKDRRRKRTRFRLQPALFFLEALRQATRDVGDWLPRLPRLPQLTPLSHATRYAGGGGVLFDMRTDR